MCVAVVSPVSGWVRGCRLHLKQLQWLDLLGLFSDPSVER